MKKEDLKSGMIVETRKGKLGIVLLDTANGDIIGGGAHINPKRTWMTLNALNDDLIYPSCYESDIVKVYKPGCGNNIYGSFDVNSMLLVWERKEIIELTFEEVARELGVDPESLKIIKK